jgi:hypothetical protein
VMMTKLQNKKGGESEFGLKLARNALPIRRKILYTILNCTVHHPQTTELCNETHYRI